MVSPTISERESNMDAFLVRVQGDPVREGLYLATLSERIGSVLVCSLWAHRHDTAQEASAP